MKRTFIGIKVRPDNQCKKIISSIQKELSGESIRWTEPDNFHITLAFIGNTEESLIPVISTMLEEKCSVHPEFEITLKSLGVFKSPEDPRVLWIGLHFSEKLISLQESITNGLIEQGIKTDDKPFSPHLTLGRIKAVESSDALKSVLLRYHSSELQRTKISDVIFYESILQQNGPLYVPLNVFGLMPSL